jgi:hypothetical protein
MNLKQATVTTLAVSLLMGTAVQSTQAFGFGDFFGKKEVKKEGAQMHKRGGSEGMKTKLKMADTSPEVQALFEELKLAREAGDEEKVTELREKMKELQGSEMAKKEAEMESALAGGYEAWKAYATEQGMPEEMLEKITAENFSIFVEVHTTRKKLRELEEQLGIKGFGAPHVFMKK